MTRDVVTFNQGCYQHPVKLIRHQVYLIIIHHNELSDVYQINLIRFMRHDSDTFFIMRQKIFLLTFTVIDLR